MRALIAGVVLTTALGCARTHTQEYAMTWSYRSDPHHVYLDFKEFPNHFVSIESAELSDYLDGLASDEVAVRFEVITRLGCVERVTATRIGDRTDWTKTWGGSGWVQHEHPSPWDRFRCRVPWW